MRLLCALLLAVLLAGCGDDLTWQTKDVSGLMPELAFELTDENGEQVSAERYRGEPLLLFFGFTHCPDVCPGTMARLAMMMREADASMRVLFVSVDPARDDPETLKAYTSVFGEKFVGLTGERAQLDALTRRYRMAYGYGEKDEKGRYDVSHPAAVFGFDSQGGARILIRERDRLSALEHDLRQLSGL